MGFFSCSHLHAPEGTKPIRLSRLVFLSVSVFVALVNAPFYFVCLLLSLGEGEIRCEQLDMIRQWICEFQTTTRQPDEAVVFDVLCGDFNFDNCSPGTTRTIINHSP